MASSFAATAHSELMRLAREDHLYRAIGVIKGAAEPLRIAEQKGAALVGGETTGKTDGQRVGVKQFTSLMHVQGAGTTSTAGTR